MKPVAKYVGYAAKGLGCLLVQNVKETPSTEHINPMAQIEVKSGNLNETQLIQTFSCMFSWNWQWRTKPQGKNCFLMRFPNKMKLLELIKFKEFSLLGTDAVIRIVNWTPESQAKGKLHTVWVKVGLVPDCMRHFFGMCEIGSAIGPVLEIDMDTILQEEIRVKVGVRDIKKIPEVTEITTKDLLFYDVSFYLQGVVEHGWYNCNYKRAGSVDNTTEQWQNVDRDDPQKRAKSTEQSVPHISLGSMSLAQFEAFQKEGAKKSNAESMMTNDKQGRSAQGEGGQTSEIGDIMKKLGQMEEEFARQAAKLALEEKKRQEIEKARVELELEVKRQSELLQATMRQLAEQEEGEHITSQTRTGVDGDRENEKDAEDEELVDYTNSQESGESFREKIERVTSKAVMDGTDKEQEDAPRRCDRLKTKEDMRVEDLAKERAAAKDNYGNSDDLDVFNSSNISLAAMASMVGIDLGCSIEMIETNLDIMRDLEQARVDIIKNNLKHHGGEMEPSSSVHIDTGDAELEELCSDQENDIENDLDFNELRQIFSAKKKWVSSSSALGCVKVAGPYSNKKIKSKNIR